MAILRGTEEKGIHTSSPCTPTSSEITRRWGGGGVLSTWGGEKLCI